jgi:hypothetical protein
VFWTSGRINERSTQPNEGCAEALTSIHTSTSDNGSDRCEVRWSLQLGSISSRQKQVLSLLLLPISIWVLLFLFLMVLTIFKFWLGEVSFYILSLFQKTGIIFVRLVCYFVKPRQLIPGVWVFFVGICVEFLLQVLGINLNFRVVQCPYTITN